MHFVIEYGFFSHTWLFNKDIFLSVRSYTSVLQTVLSSEEQIPFCLCFFLHVFVKHLDPVPSPYDVSLSRRLKETRCGQAELEGSGVETCNTNFYALFLLTVF